jgi:alkanesulfonate monooxygenase SsuD/methylene tetrahydromethanopterin reductase-like flavin-dependent oxidoreductase (luciferase family)
LPVIGDATRIAEQLAQLSASGIDGVLLTWVDFQNGIRRFGAEVLPQLQSMNLRAPKPV